MPERFKKATWSERRRDRLRYFRYVPMRRLWALLGAAFCLFAATGFMIQLLNRASAPLEITLVWVLWSGILAVAYILVLARAPKFIPLLIAVHITLQVLLSLAQNRLLHVLPMHHIPLTRAVVVYGGIMLGLTMTSYALFFIYIQNEGQQAIRNITELELAHGIQATLVPPIRYRDDRVDLYAVSRPSAEVGGDIVDLLEDRGSLFLYVGDISGHGLQAGILMGMLKAAIRSLLIEGTSTTRLLQNLNQVLPVVKESNMYATLATLRLAFSAQPNGDRGNAEYAFAGHPPILHYRARENDVVALTKPALPLGLLPDAEYGTVPVSFAAGDLFVLATDGVSEVEDEQSREFGMEGITRCMLNVVGRVNAEMMVEGIAKDVRAFGRQVDDQTVLCVRIL